MCSLHSGGCLFWGDHGCKTQFFMLYGDYMEMIGVLPEAGTWMILGRPPLSLLECLQLGRRPSFMSSSA